MPSSTRQTTGQRSAPQDRGFLSLGHMSAHVSLLFLCTIHDFRTQMNTLILLGFCCAKERGIMGA